jgi:hypothetical protein
VVSLINPLLRKVSRVGIKFVGEDGESLVEEANDLDDVLKL